ncbi:MAG: hypothetical protein AAF748_14255 [Pseudomonadota bacterium]
MNEFDTPSDRPDAKDRQQSQSEINDRRYNRREEKTDEAAPVYTDWASI